MTRYQVSIMPIYAKKEEHNIWRYSIQYYDIYRDPRTQPTRHLLQNVVFIFKVSLQYVKYCFDFASLLIVQ